MVVHVRGETGRVSQHTMYVSIGVNLLGKKELLGLWLAETEGAKFWLSCLTDLKNRGLNDIFLVCVDGLTGFPEAIRTAYPQTKVQLCIVHLVRAALKYVTDKDSKAVAADLKKIYQSATAGEAEQELDRFAEVWSPRISQIARSFRHGVCAFFLGKTSVSNDFLLKRPRNPMGESQNDPLRLAFDRQLKLEFHGSIVTTDSALLAYRKLDDALALTGTAATGLHDRRTRQNTRHRLLALLRQSVYSRLAGYEDVNDAERLCLDPALRAVVGGRAKNQA